MHRPLKRYLSFLIIASVGPSILLPLINGCSSAAPDLVSVGQSQIPRNMGIDIAYDLLASIELWVG